MRKAVTTILACFILTQTIGQTSKKISTYLQIQYNHTQYDRTLGNNPWSVGLGLQAFLNTRTKFRPTIELTADGALESDKVLYLALDNKSVNAAVGVINLFAGSSFLPTKNLYLSFALGPSFINNNTYLGIKPSIGFYFLKRERMTARISYINIFNRELNYQETKKDDFGSISFAIGIRLF